MLFKNENEFSLFPKCFFLAAIIFVTLLAGHLMFNDIPMCQGSCRLN